MYTGIIFAIAASLCVNYTLPTQREDGTPLTGKIEYVLQVSNQADMTASDEYKIGAALKKFCVHDIVAGDYYLQIFTEEDGLRGTGSNVVHFPVVLAEDVTEVDIEMHGELRSCDSLVLLK